MQAPRRKLVAIGLAAVLAAPVAFSHPASAESPAGSAAAAQKPTQTDTRASDAVSARTTAREAKPPPPAASAAAGSRDSMAAEAPPPQGKGEQHATTHSTVVSRETWLKLDADADSRISLGEAASDPDLAASFAVMDSNGDGFVTQTEYDAYARKDR